MFAVLGSATLCSQPLFAETVVEAPAAKLISQDVGKRETAVFAGGCFWGVEAVFSHMEGVTSVVSGFTGGARGDADYATVSRGGTRHAEAVKVTWDPKKVRYDQLLQVYFSVIADPTLLNRQGPDVGSHYRSALMPLNAEQARVARGYLAQLREAGLWSRPIVTKVEPFRGFFPAEAYHQDFMLRNPRHGYILRWDAPKVAALKKLYPALYKPSFTNG
ncbi:peptide-methionine (S)-S-oxide reductase MsrA [Novosphingobium sp. RD2P27]|uniref:Peptide methionine sulfoxide reductase MsrA n=1 Tax=Novosphingobium kalidii TaxID=3230299 RepID=A0ABV2D523_9SPHN